MANAAASSIAADNDQAGIDSAYRAPTGQLRCLPFRGEWCESPCLKMPKTLMRCT